MIRQVVKGSRKCSTLFRSSIVRCLSTTDGENDSPQSRDEQVRGAMRDFFKKTEKTGDDIWSKLSQQAESKPSKAYKAYKKENVDETEGEGRGAMRARGANTRYRNNNANRTDPLEGTGNGSANERRRRDLVEMVEEDEQEREDDISPLERSLLFDLDFFHTMVKEGKEEIDVNDMDPMDHMFAEAFVESFKTRDSSYRVYIENKHDVNPHRKGVQHSLPVPRSSLQLLYAQQFKCDVDRQSPGYALAQPAWQVIRRNVYYSDTDRRLFSNHLAHLHNSFHSYALSLSEQEIDPVFDEDFRPGPDFIEREREREAMRLAVGGRKGEEGGVQGETNWEVEAVEDEDQL